MSRPASVRRFAITLVLLVVIGGSWVLFLRLQPKDLTLAFTREELQQRVATKFPLDQKLLVFTVTYSDPVVKLEEGSDRIGLKLDATARLVGARVGKGTVEGDWKIRYEPTEGALYCDDLKIDRFVIEGLPPATQDTVAQLARPLVQEYLARVPVYRLKPGDLRQDLARSVLKSVTVRDGRLLVVVGALWVPSAECRVPSAER